MPEPTHHRFGRVGVLLDNWSRSAPSPEVRVEVLDLAAEIRRALKDGRIEEAQPLAGRMHALSQNNAVLHCYGHFLNAKVCQRNGQTRPALRHAYLTLMAPYGTLRRRMRGARAGIDTA